VQVVLEMLVEPPLTEGGRVEAETLKLDIRQVLLLQTVQTVEMVVQIVLPGPKYIMVVVVVAELLRKVIGHQALVV
jgi:hypothetical protein